MTKCIETMIAQCVECQINANRTSEPLRPTATPERPWQMVGSDLLQYQGQTYLIVVDYYSRYPELALLGKSDFSSQRVISIMKSMFSRHGIPELVISDNGPQYASQEFSGFAQEYGFKHVTSSPHYPRANGAAERAVQTIKSMLKKEKDPYLALLAYRSSPQFGCYSPAELLMGRRLRTTVVDHPDNLRPALIDHESFRKANDHYKHQMKANHDKNPRVKPMEPVREGEKVIIRDNQQLGVVAKQSDITSRKVQISTESGTMTRNRADVTVLPSSRPTRQVNTPIRFKDYECSF